MRRALRQRGAAKVPWALTAGAWALALGLVMVWQEPPAAWVRATVRFDKGGRVWGSDVVCRGLAGKAEGKVWFGRTNRNGTCEIKVLPGRLEVEAVGSTHTAPRRVAVEDGGVREVELVYQPTLWGTDRLNLFAPERVFLTSEQPSLGVEGKTDQATAEVTIDRLDLDRLVVERGGGAWFSAWGDSVGITDLKNLAPYLHRAAELTVNLRDSGTDGRFLRYVDLPVEQPGFYLANVSVGTVSERFAFQVTDLALVAKVDSKQIVAYACHLATGAPRSGVDLELWSRDGDGRLATASSDSSGLVRLPASDPAAASFVLLAREGDQQALIKVERYDYDDGERVIHVYTDRPIYRPGHHVYLKGLVRDRSAAGFALPPAGEPVKVTVSDGRGEQVAELRTATTALGSFTTDFVIPEEAFTGYFDVSTSVNGHRGYCSFPVKAYVKPEYQVTAVGPKGPVDRDGTVPVQVQADYFFGAPVAHGEVRYTVRRHDTWWSPWYQPEEDLEPWAEELYRADDGYDYSWGEEVLSGTARLDEFGHLLLELPARQLVPPPRAVVGTDDEGQPIVPSETRPWGVDVELSVLDGSGRREQGVASAIVLSADIDLEANLTHSWIGPADDAELRLRSRRYDGLDDVGRRVTVETYQTRYVWDCRYPDARDHQGSWVRPSVPDGPYAGCSDTQHCTYSHRFRRIVRPGPTVDLATGREGRAQCSLRLPWPGGWSLVARTTDDQGRPAVRVEYCYVSDTGGTVPDLDYSADLELLHERDRYLPGDAAKVRVQAKSETGWVFLAHEGQEVSEPQILALRDHAAAGSVHLGDGDIPNTWAGAAQVRDKELLQESASLDVDLRAKLLEVKVTCNVDHAHPRDWVTFTVATSRHGQPVDAEVSLAVVDESIYAMRADHPEQAVLAFYGRQWNRVETFFSAARYYYNAGKESDGQVRRNFPDTALWRPLLRTGSSGQVQVRMQLPDNLTTWRATAIAHTVATEIGFGKTTVLVNKPLMVRLELPRFLTQHDRATLRAVVHNESGTDLPVRAVMEVDGLGLQGAAERSFRLATGDRRTLSWQVAADRPVAATVRVTAAAGPHRDAVEQTLKVEPFAQLTREVRRPTVEGGSGPVDETIELPPGAMLDASVLRVQVSPTVAGAVMSAVDDLIGYPYGCVEQTSSKYLGCLAAAQAYRALGWRPEPGTEADKLAEMVRRGVLRVRRMQNWDGSWGWWEGEPFDEFMTAYALHGLLTAKEAGYPVSNEVVEQGLDRLAKAVDETKPRGDDGLSRRALAAWVLARAGHHLPATAFSRLLDTKLPYDAAGMAFTALAAKAAGDRTAHQRALARLWKCLPHEQLDTAPVEDLAWSLTAILDAEGPSPRAAALVAALNHSFDGDHWIATRQTCAAVQALSAYLGRVGLVPVRGTLKVTVNGAALQPFAFTDENCRGRGASFTVSGDGLRAGPNLVRLELDGVGRPEALVVASTRVATDRIQPLASPRGMTVERRYQLLRRKRVGGYGFVDLPSGATRVDDVVRVTLTVQAKTAESHLLVEDPLPAGFEVLERGEVVHDAEWDSFEGDSRWAARDVKDDRVATFVTSLRAGDKVRLRYLLRAAVPGSYRVMPTLVQPMYEPDASCSGADARLSVQ